MKQIKLSNWVLDDIDTLKETLAEFVGHLRTPWTLIPTVLAAMVAAIFIWLPWLAE